MSARLEDRWHSLLFDEEQSWLLNAEHRVSRDGEMKGRKKRGEREREENEHKKREREIEMEETDGCNRAICAVVNDCVGLSCRVLLQFSYLPPCSGSFTQIKYRVRIEKSREREREEVEYVDIRGRLGAFLFLSFSPSTCCSFSPFSVCGCSPDEVSRALNDTHCGGCVATASPLFFL